MREYKMEGAFLNHRMRRFAILVLFLILGFIQGQGCGKRGLKNSNNSEQSNSPFGFGEPDTFYNYQWYLGGKSLATSVNLGIPEVWSKGNFGQDTQIAIVDPSSIYLNHTDITDNKDLTKSFNFIYPTKNSDTTFAGGSSHGTCVAGVIGARELNGKGVRGVSSRAKISARNTTGVDTDIYEALTYKYSETDVACNSYGPPDDVSELNQYYNQDLFKKGIELGLKSGRAGLGTVFVWAAGNGKQNSDRSNYDGYASHFGVMSVCSVGATGAVSFFSEPGSNLWVCAPGEKIVTTDYQALNCSESSSSNLKDLPNSEYTQNFTGTSASAPIVSGGVGLILQAAKQVGKSIGWRDVKMLIAESATQPNIISWQPTRIGFNDDYGFGILNVAGAVALLDTWPPVGNYPWISNIFGASLLGPVGSGALDDVGTSYLSMKNFIVNNAAAADGISTFHSTISYIEHVSLEIMLSHADPGDLEISLVKSPLSGGASAQSKIATPHSCFNEGSSTPCSSISNYTYEFGVSNFLGESAEGVWTLKIRDGRTNGKVGSVTGWRLKVYGH